ncbi:MAG: hypothetical protein V6Z89_07060 [Desulfobacter sp.]
MSSETVEFIPQFLTPKLETKTKLVRDIKLEMKLKLGSEFKLEKLNYIIIDKNFSGI